MEAELLKGVLRGRLSSRAAQESLVGKCRENAATATKIEINKAVVGVLQRLEVYVRRFVGNGEKAVDNGLALRSKADEVVLANKLRRDKVTTGSLAEIDVSTPEMFEEFYRENALDSATLLEAATDSSHVTAAKARLLLGSDKSILESVMRRTAKHFLDRIRRSLQSQNFSARCWHQNRRKPTQLVGDSKKPSERANLCGVPNPGRPTWFLATRS